MKNISSFLTDPKLSEINALMALLENLPPLRSDVLQKISISQLARESASRDKDTSSFKDLSSLLSSNCSRVSEIYELLDSLDSFNNKIQLNAEQFIDNFYVIKKQLQIANSYPRTLFKVLRKSYFLYESLADYLSSTDCQYDIDLLVEFIIEYQIIHGLSYSEIKNIPNFLRLLLIENVCRLCCAVARMKLNHILAKYWVNNVARDNSNSAFFLEVRGIDCTKQKISDSFLVPFFQQVSGTDLLENSQFNDVLEYITDQTKTSSADFEQLFQENIQIQHADGISLRNTINFLRHLDTYDWDKFTQATSLTHAILQREKSPFYAQMEFDSQKLYILQIQDFAKKNFISETKLAEIAVALTFREELSVKGHNTAHVGYFIMGAGREIFKRQAGIRIPPSKKLFNFFSSNSVGTYLFCVIILTVLIQYAISYYFDFSVNGQLFLFAFYALCSSQLAVTLINNFVSKLFKPKLLPRLDYTKGIAQECRTLIVIPCFLINDEKCDDLLVDLETKYLANKGKYLHYGLLTDFQDSDIEISFDEEKLLIYLKDKILKLNDKYKNIDNQGAVFFLFHRHRKWNEIEHCWMGHERKRGKLFDLCDLLRGFNRANFKLIEAPLNLFHEIRYLITLDVDTKLPKDSVVKMVGAMAHPLNKAVYSPNKKRVTSGYGILQPMTTEDFSSSNDSFYSQIYGNSLGVDAYTRVYANLYQDLFDEGSFIGKGILDIDIFQQTLKDRLPENRILSHDLLEGCYLRSGLISDVKLYEDHPVNYIAEVKRRQRWIRGDWQIATWILPFVPSFSGGKEKNTLNLLSRWKIFDNLRRSLIPIAYLTVLVFNLGTENIKPALIFILSCIFLPSVMFLAQEFLRNPLFLFRLNKMKLFLSNAKTGFLQSLISLMNLPFEAFYHFISILKTHYRILISRKKLLEWNQSSNYQFLVKHKKINILFVTWANVFLSIATFIFFLRFKAEALNVFWPLLVLWLISPIIVWWLGRPFGKTEEKHTKSKEIKILALKSWMFFVDFVNDEENWLPPDNFQEYPFEKIAHKTSPTNIGLSLLANLTAFDFGFITSNQLSYRSRKTLNTMARLERYRGHFMNWYSTRTLNPILPKYVSTVDSGNLLGSLYVLKSGLEEIQDRPILGQNELDGLYVIFDLLVSEAGTITEGMSEFQSLWNNFTESKKYNLVSINEFLKAAKKISTVIKHNFSQNRKEERYNLVLLLDTQILLLANEIRTLAPWIDQEIEFTIINRFFDPLHIPTLSGLKNSQERILSQLEIAINTESNDLFELNKLKNILNDVFLEANKRLSEISLLVKKCEDYLDIEFDFLYDESQHQLSIGFNLENNLRDKGCYDLLASEARLSVFIAVAQNKIPERSWFALGRPSADLHGTQYLLSWSGSMFEYLMPLIIMPTFKNTLLDNSYKLAVEKQILYGKENQVPWGVSESAYNEFDTHLNYGYRPNGIPDLSIQTKHDERVVIAPYATTLALMVDSEKSVENLQSLKQLGAEGKYGFYEAIDYGLPEHGSAERSFEIVYSYMVHHIGMGFLSVGKLLNEDLMQKRFASNLELKANLLLLQEKSQHINDLKKIKLIRADRGAKLLRGIYEETEINDEKTILDYDTKYPEIQIVTNGTYQVIVNNSGSGFSKWKDIVINRWRQDAIGDNYGAYIYIKDRKYNKLWSSSFQPTLIDSSDYNAEYSEGTISIARIEFGIESNLKIIVSQEHDLEIRQIEIRNNSDETRSIDLTSYSEIILSRLIDDLLDTSFNKLFIESEIVSSKNGIIFHRRSTGQYDTPYFFHTMVTDEAVKSISFETDRLRFVGRGKTAENPEILLAPSGLSNSDGNSSDTIASIQGTFDLAPGAKIAVNFIYGIQRDRESCLKVLETVATADYIKKQFDVFKVSNQAFLKKLSPQKGDIKLFRSIAGSIIYPRQEYHPRKQFPDKLLKLSDLQKFSLSGDAPIVLFQICDYSKKHYVEKMLKAFSFWCLKGLYVDLIICNHIDNNYSKFVKSYVTDLIESYPKNHIQKKSGRISFLNYPDLEKAERELIERSCCIKINTEDGFDQFVEAMQPAPRGYVEKKRLQQSVNSVHTGLSYFNGYGGYEKNGSEYTIKSSNTAMPPMPWSNILSNADFGSIVSDGGHSYTWALNSKEYKLSESKEDAISDTPSEAYYIKDESNGNYWSLSSLPSPSGGEYTCTHGFGYSRYKHTAFGISTEMLVFVDRTKKIKFCKISVLNGSLDERKLSVTGFVDWVLDSVKFQNSIPPVIERDALTGAVFASNENNACYGDKVCFYNAIDSIDSFTTCRREFVGRNKNLKKPLGLITEDLSNKIGSSDPCAALRKIFTLGCGEEKTVSFILGCGDSIEESQSLVLMFSDQESINKAFDEVCLYWNNTLSNIQIKTPNGGINYLMNGWLNYQTISSRLLGRAGYYQAKGAFVFKDQMQDTLAILHIDSNLVRDYIIKFASHQFIQGDVLQWWDPVTDFGFRTKSSDDHLWLVFSVFKYISHTNDHAILKESIPYLNGPLLGYAEDSIFYKFLAGEESATLLEHCLKAMKLGLELGENGLALIRLGDWNIGLDNIGTKYDGESVWLSFFLYDVLMKFSSLLDDKEHSEVKRGLKESAQNLIESIEKFCWDGDWYNRAFNDENIILGSKDNLEFQIDSITQSWAILSSGSDKIRGVTAMENAFVKLVDTEKKIVRLFNPPFLSRDLNPGKIRAYPPGTRENGSHLNEAVIWMAMAFAKMNDTQRMSELLSILNPLSHSDTKESADIYKSEPYLIGNEIQVSGKDAGRGGWSWYTGAAGWMYQLILEYVLGIKIIDGSLTINPCLPFDWKNVSVEYKHQHSIYLIEINQVLDLSNSVSYMFNGVPQNDNKFLLKTNGGTNNIDITIYCENHVDIGSIK